MTVTIDRQAATAALQGDCPAEDAEPLAAALEPGGIDTVDLARCGQIHAAVVQALLMFRPKMCGDALDPFVRSLLQPALAAAGLTIRSGDTAAPDRPAPGIDR
jgi:hypothetical protein